MVGLRWKSLKSNVDRFQAKVKKLKPILRKTSISKNLMSQANLRMIIANM